MRVAAGVLGGPGGADHQRDQLGDADVVADGAGALGAAQQRLDGAMQLVDDPGVLALHGLDVDPGAGQGLGEGVLGGPQLDPLREEREERRARIVGGGLRAVTGEIIRASGGIT